MKIHRFYVPEDILKTFRNEGRIEITEHSSDDIYFDPEEFIHQMSHVLRFRTGDVLHVFNSDVGEFKAEIVTSHKKGIEIKMIEEVEVSEPIKKDITLGMSIIKKDNFELVVEKATELGVSTIIPFISERSIKKELSDTRLLRIAKEATEQSGRLSVPDIRDIISFEEVVNLKDNYDTCLFGNMNGKVKFSDLQKDLGKVLVLVGPEGGWTDGEVEVMESAGFQSISINENTLRAETAAIGLVTLLSV